MSPTQLVLQQIPKRNTNFVELQLFSPFPSGCRYKWPYNSIGVGSSMATCCLPVAVGNGHRGGAKKYSSSSLVATSRASDSHQFAPSTLSNRLIPPYLGKFVNHLMLKGKKGTAVDVFACSLQLFLKRLQESRHVSFSLVDETIKKGGKAKARSVERVNAPLQQSMEKGAVRGGTQSPKKDLVSNLSSIGDGALRSPEAPFDGTLLHTTHDRTSPSSSVALLLSRKDPFFLKKPGAHLSGLAFSSPHRSSIGDRSSTPLPPSLLAEGSESYPSQQESWYPIVDRLVPSLQRQVKRVGSFDARQDTHNSGALPPSLLNCLERALGNVEPSLEVRRKKIAGITRQIPSIVPKSRGEGLAIRWIIDSARERRRKQGKMFSECLAEELVSAYHKTGEPRQKRDSLHKLAESNRSFLRYRWW